jgi:hypothetical protein
VSVSGLGTSRTPFPAPLPHSGAAPATRPERAAKPRSGFEKLTDADRNLIRHVTGQRIGPGFDPAAEPTSLFAAAIAGDRVAGRLAPGQEVTAVYLKDLERRFQRTGGPNPIAPYLDKAVRYLQGAGPSHFDVSA